MKAVLVMFDSLKRSMLPPYGCDWVHAPNFLRLAERTAVFDQCFVGSMPCMPARREMHTGRYGFLHRSWGPIEPFDESMPEILAKNGIHSHIVTDHFHYWEDGGATYLQRFASFETVRGQESDVYRCILGKDQTPAVLGQERLEKNPERKEHIRQHWQNRLDNPEGSIRETADRGIRFLSENHEADNWYLQIEMYDPHEPFDAPKKYQDLYPHKYRGPCADWPEYGKTDLYTEEELNHIQMEYAAMISMCDEHLGRILDAMDRYDLWKDTLLIVNTDHGFLTGEHGWVGKGKMPFFNELANIPLFIWDPRCRAAAARRKSLVQTIDLAPTVLGCFGLDAPKTMQGHDLAGTIAEDVPVREAARYGIHGAHVCCYDGRFTYFRGWGEKNEPLFNYTLMPTHMRGFFSREELEKAEYGLSFSFTGGVSVLKTPVKVFSNSMPQDGSSWLYDLQNDPGQEHPLQDEKEEARMKELLIRLMRESEAPEEQFKRLQLI